MIPNTKVWNCSSQIAPHANRSGESVIVLRPLNDEEADLFETGPMFRCAFISDGVSLDVFEEELS